MTTENEFMAAVLRQLLVTKLDFQRLADDTELSSAEAARSRWRRMKAKLEGSRSSDNRSVTPVKTPVSTPAPRKEPAKKNNVGGKRKDWVGKINDFEDDEVRDAEEKKVLPPAKRGRGRPKRVVAEEPKVVTPESDKDNESGKGSLEDVIVDEFDV
ncbi:hypothetical protein VTL71DRAFT_9846 [Oculimacula yallundae]|uniref:Myb-like DNA-binding domain-containing protein n=1 Tax=Oculimacula yallundae TaxID=86028 RepID=A0ABR4BQN0_9HELO